MQIHQMRLHGTGSGHQPHLVTVAGMLYWSPPFEQRKQPPWVVWLSFIRWPGWNWWIPFLADKCPMRRTFLYHGMEHEDIVKIISSFIRSWNLLIFYSPAIAISLWHEKKRRWITHCIEIENQLTEHIYFNWCMESGGGVQVTNERESVWPPSMRSSAHHAERCPKENISADNLYFEKPSRMVPTSRNGFGNARSKTVRMDSYYW